MTDAEPIEPPEAPEPAETPEAPEPTVVTPPFPLPTARTIVSRGLELAVRETEHLRRASLYMGLLFLGLAGPALTYTVFLATSRPDVIDLFLTAADPVATAEAATYGGTLGLLFIAAAAGIVVLGVEGQAIAMSLLAASHVGRPMALGEAVVRSRQSFWRIVGGSFAVGIVSSIVQTLVTTVGDAAAPSAAEATSFIAVVIAAICTAPFGYLVAGIVLGDVGAVESLRRSVRLTRARPRLAIVIALFTTFASILQFFAIGAAGDILFRIVDVFGLGFEAGGVVAIASFGLTLATIVAFGSLVFTMGAIVLAPQVVAFVGLTHHHAGLDRARAAASAPPELAPDDLPAAPGWGSPPRAAAPRFRWVTLPAAATIGLAVFVAVSGILSAA